MLNTVLCTQNDEHIDILHPGTHNTDAGPDFLYARIRIGGTVWAGNIEIHVKSSDWFRHGHEKDPAYNNVILHVVGENDRVAIDATGRKLPSLSITGKFNSDIFHRFHEIHHNLLWIPCMKLIRDTDKILIINTIHAHAVDRLRAKADGIRQDLIECNMDWEECCYRIIAKQFGARVNTSQFEMLAKSLSVRLLMRYYKDLNSLEALLFGQSGMLISRTSDTYSRALKKEYKYLSQKHDLSHMPGYLWKFLRLRPAGFPTIRISQLASLYEQNQSLLQEILEQKDIPSLVSLFQVSSSAYWNDHYVFGKKSKNIEKKFGDQGIRLLLINAIIPMLHLYGDYMHKPELCDRAIAFLEDLPPENNAVIRRWESLGVQAVNAMETQGLLQLKKTDCNNKQCLECSIGHSVLKGPK